MHRYNTTGRTVLGQLMINGNMFALYGEIDYDQNLVLTRTTNGRDENRVRIPLDFLLNYQEIIKNIFEEWIKIKDQNLK